MIKRILKALGVTCLIFIGMPLLVLLGTLFRLMGERFGYHDGGALGILFLLVFSMAYLFLWGFEE
jgi:hypothetical protein